MAAPVFHVPSFAKSNMSQQSLNQKTYGKRCHDENVPILKNENNKNSSSTNNDNSNKNNGDGQQKSRRPLQAVVSNSNSVRVQPPRQAKKKQKTTTFEVFSDEPTKDVSNVGDQAHSKGLKEVVSNATKNADVKRPKEISSDPTQPEEGADRMKAEKAAPNRPTYLQSPKESAPALTSPSDISAEAEELGVNDIYDNPEEIYANDIYTNLLAREKRSLPKPRYMMKQADINHAMRKILVNWMVEVCEELRLSSETLFIAVSLTDRFLSKMSVLRGKLQLVGATALFLAAKYEEIYPPGVKDFIYLTDDCYTVDQLFRMEVLVLRVLDYDVASPFPLAFLSHLSKWAGSDETTTVLSHYIVELAMTEGEFYVSHTPSMMAASAICVAKHILGFQPWSDELTKLSGYSKQDLQSCVRNLCDLMSASIRSDQQTVREKYCNVKYLQVAHYNPPSHYPF